MGATALMLATGQAHVLLVQALIDQGAEIDLQVTITDSVGWSVRRSVGWLVGRSFCHDFLKSEKLHFHDLLENLSAPCLALYFNHFNIDEQSSPKEHDRQSYDRRLTSQPINPPINQQTDMRGYREEV